MNEIDPSKIKLLDQIQICEKKQKSFRELEISLSLQKAKKYSYLGDRISMNFHKKKNIRFISRRDYDSNIYT